MPNLRKNLTLNTFIICLLIAVICISNNAYARENLGFKDLPGKHEIGMRTRYQSINDNWLGNAEAYTTRLTLTSSFNLDDEERWQLLLQPNLVYAFNDGDYNSVTVKQNTAAIPDPESFDINKVYLAYQSDNNWQVKLGRQALSFDNERFIGAIEFWQKPQSFDAFTASYNNNINWRIQYAYTNKVHRIFGHKSKNSIPEGDVRLGVIARRPINELGEHRLDTHLLNVEYKTENNLNIVGYNYLIENETQPNFSTQTVGLNIKDEFKPNKFKFRYSLEFATQQDFANNPKNYNAWYSLLEVSTQYKSHLFQLSQEVLSANNKQAFITPLGTNHKFQGWADVFSGYGLQTGLRDQYLTYKGRDKKFRWRGVYHRFVDYQNGENIGNEIDIELAYRASRKWEFKVIYAKYRKDKGLIYIPNTNNDLSMWFASVAYNI